MCLQALGCLRKRPPVICAYFLRLEHDPEFIGICPEPKNLLGKYITFEIKQVGPIVSKSKAKIFLTKLIVVVIVLQK